MIDPEGAFRAAPPRHIVATRGGLVESRHVVHAAVSDGEGLLAAFGDAGHFTWYRSAAKAFQALVVVRSGAAERFGLGPRELAIACGSHTGTPMHTSLVLDLLARGGLDVTELGCGSHPPLDEAAARDLAAAGEAPSALHHNCSGKHAAMLLRCVHEGWPTATYLEPEHPHQVEIRQVIAAYGGLAPADVRVGLDGCSAPVWGVPLSAMARSFARLAQGVGPDGNPGPAMVRVRSAIQAHPELVGGPGRLDTEFLRAAGGEYVVKIGAEAVYGVGHLPTGRGLAFKVADGAMRAVEPALFDLLRELGWPVPPGLARLERPVLTNFRGLKVGELRPEGAA